MMFTGLVTAMGTVRALAAAGDGVRLEVASVLFDNSISTGESVAVNGACLTVVHHVAGAAAFELAPETLRKTNLGGLGVGMQVNLERALRLGDRLGGHWVQGHVDGRATLRRRERDGDWERFVFGLSAEWAGYLVEKGSVTVNGVSLTVVEAGADWFSVALIPHTLATTNLGAMQPGEEVNVEVDILAKYVRRALGVNVAAREDEWIRKPAANA